MTPEEPKQQVEREEVRDEDLADQEVTNLPDRQAMTILKEPPLVGPPVIAGGTDYEEIP